MKSRVDAYGAGGLLQRSGLGKMQTIGQRAGRAQQAGPVVTRRRQLVDAIDDLARRRARRHQEHPLRARLR